jgi:UDP-N-acetylglucosamine transferase subunit ALG13
LAPSSEAHGNGNGSAERLLVFVTVGTDHHPFDRLVDWVDRWLEQADDERIQCVVQHGTSAAPTHTTGHAYLGFDEVRSTMREAQAVICHGGPGTIMLSRSVGRRPIVVPRRHGLGEHVDDHQVAFSRRIAADGTIELAETEERFLELLQQALYEGTSTATRSSAAAPQTIERFEELLERRLGLGRS